jgi:hypothetical protein
LLTTSEGRRIWGMTGYGFPMTYSWNGEPIPDIHAWCRERGEKMVRVRKTWREPNLFAGRFEDREEVMEMPEAFFKCIRFGGMRDENYTAIESYNP